MPYFPPAAVAARITVATASALAATSVTDLAVGTEAWVQSFKDEFELSASLPYAADGITVISSPVVGTGWVRRSLGNLEWAAQTAWFIDSATGNDENVGSALLPIASFAEWCRRVGDVAINVTMRVTLVGAGPYLLVSPVGSPIVVGPAGLLDITGSATTTSTNTLSAVTNIAPATNQQTQITAVAVAWTQGARIRLTSGVNSGCIGWIGKDLTGGVARTTVFMPVYSGSGVITVYPVSVNPGVGNTYAIESLSAVTEFLLDIRASQDRATQTQGTHAIIRNIAFARGATRTFIGIPNVIFQACSLGSFSEGNGAAGFFQNCWIPDFFVQVGSNAFVIGGLITSSIYVPPTSRALFQEVYAQDLSNGSVIDGGSVNIATNFGGVGSGLGVFAATGPGLELDTLAHVYVIGRLYGTGNSTYGVRVRSGCSVVYSPGTVPVITGTTNDFICGVTAGLWATAPVFDSIHGALLTARA